MNLYIGTKITFQFWSKSKVNILVPNSNINLYESSESEPTICLLIWSVVIFGQHICRNDRNISKLTNISYVKWFVAIDSQSVKTFNYRKKLSNQCSSALTIGFNLYLRPFLILQYIVIWNTNPSQNQYHHCHHDIFFALWFEKIILIKSLESLWSFCLHLSK